MTREDFTQFLVADIQATGDDTFVQTLLTSARAKILAGGGEISPLTTAGLNGKTFGRSLRMDAAEVATACREALDIVAGDAAVVSTLDFSCLE